MKLITKTKENVIHMVDLDGTICGTQDFTNIDDFNIALFQNLIWKPIFKKWSILTARPGEDYDIIEKCMKFYALHPSKIITSPGQEYSFTSIDQLIDWKLSILYDTATHANKVIYYDKDINLIKRMKIQNQNSKVEFIKPSI